MLPRMSSRCQCTGSGMAYPSVGPEAVLAFRLLLYCMSCIFGGAAVIAISVYIVLLGSEILFSRPHHKQLRANSSQSAHTIIPVEATFDLHTVKPVILDDTEQPW